MQQTNIAFTPNRQRIHGNVRITSLASPAGIHGRAQNSWLASMPGATHRKDSVMEFGSARPLRAPLGALALSACLAAVSGLTAAEDATLVGRAVLPAATFAPGPTSGQQLGATAINGQTPPFVGKQPVQGFSAVLDNKDGTFLAMCDNGFGALENSSDFNLRAYRIRPNFKTASGGDGSIAVLGRIELHDPDRRIPFAITNHFSSRRTLTGADFDIESLQRAPDGTLWFGDEFGPFLLHTDAAGKVLEAPIPLPDFDRPGQQVRSPQNPFNEESSAVRIMNAVRNHARSAGGVRTPVFSPYHVMLVDGDPAVDHYARGPIAPTGSGLAPAASDIFDIDSLRRAGYPVIPYTVNDSARMTALIARKVDGIISDRPDLLFQAALAAGFVGADGLIDATRFDAQGHRGGRNLRPENTLPGMEVALDFLMTTLEADCALTKDWVPVLSHDPYLMAQKVRRADGSPYGFTDEKLIKDVTFAQLQTQYIADKVFRGATQTNDRALSPVAKAFAAARGLMDPYVVPSLQQLFDFSRFYVRYYRSGAGSTHPEAAKRWKNAARVRFNLETKINPSHQLDEHGRVFASRTVGPLPFSLLIAGTIAANRLNERADVQSFDFRTLLWTQRIFPSIRTVYLFGDFPIYADRSNPDSDDTTNLQDEFGANTPWLAGLAWPYRVTRLDHPFRATRSGGFEGMAITPNGKKLLPLLEKPLVGDDAKTLLIHEFDLKHRRYTGARHRYRLEAGGTAIGDFALFEGKRGLIIERDESQGNLAGFKRIFEVTLGAPESYVDKEQAVDLIAISDPHAISLPGRAGDVGLGTTFAFPFQTIEDVIIFDRKRIGVLNDNNFPFSTGRNPGLPDDNEFIILELDRPLGKSPRLPSHSG